MASPAVYRRAATALRIAMTRLKQSGQAKRTPPPRRVRDSGRIVDASTGRRHSGHRLILDWSLGKFSPRE